MERGAVPDELAGALRREGAVVLPPRPELPDVLIALFPDTMSAPEAAERAARLRGVAYAEPEEFRFGG
ncbi:hypothetical protein [Nonomuraea sp. NPDC050540]|uniref:hypothetical protein n=1 Tax=Nonomuraea sp. NPDC050540 TaxID=3364367 RepID=UPI0037A32264